MLGDQPERPEFDDLGLRRRRARKSTGKIDRDEIASRVIDFADDDLADRTIDMDMRLQRYAKFRMWNQGGDGWPWEGSSDVGLPDMMTNVLSLEDTLHNAVMSNRPVVVARAIDRHDQEKESKVDDLIDSQLFIEQDGEKAVEEAADSFVMDGCVVAFVPWIREDRLVSHVRTFDKIPKKDIPKVHLERIIQQEYPAAYFEIIPQDDEGWDWLVMEGDVQEFEVKFYTNENDEVEMVSRRSVRVYDGPKVIVKDYEDVLSPTRCSNLQAPSPSNPGGATHVILVDHPSVDEIERLYESGFYDLMTKKEVEELHSTYGDKTFDDAKTQKDAFQGKQQRGQKERDSSHEPITRYLCFDIYPDKKNGDNIDMIWWVLREPRLLVKAKPLCEMYPTIPPRRPICESSFIPVKGRREGISLLEMMESLHDFKKQTFDQAVDAGTIGNSPFWFYRATSNIKPEVIRLWPGDGIPLSDPKNDVFFPNIGAGQAQTFALNMMTLADAMQEKLTVRGDLQLGRVPIGRSSALRTSQNLQAFMSAGEARPERILRRFMMFWVQVYRQFHELNRHFLQDEKKLRILGYKDVREDPYMDIKSSRDIDGSFLFDFSVNVLNASKLAVQEAIEKVLPIVMSPLPLQMGIVDPNGVYRLMRDYLNSVGQHADKYINPPSPDALAPPILAEEAIGQILKAQMPVGFPLEGAQAHLQKLQGFMKMPEFAFLDTPDKVEMFRSYMRGVQERVKAEEMARAASQQQGAQLPGRPAGSPPGLGPPMVNDNELLDETLPSAGGGGNGGMQ